MKIVMDKLESENTSERDIQKFDDLLQAQDLKKQEIRNDLDLCDH